MVLQKPLTKKALSSNILRGIKSVVLFSSHARAKEDVQSEGKEAVAMEVDDEAKKPSSLERSILDQDNAEYANQTKFLTPSEVRFQDGLGFLVDE